MSIFEHHHHHGGHDHDHDHDHEHGEQVVVDPAQKALADALQVSFTILKWAMLIMVVIYCVSNVYNVEADKVAVRLQFGHMVTDSSNAVKVDEPGGPYIALPFPINEVIKVSRSPRKVDLQTQFMWEITAADAGKTTEEMAQGKQGPLNPEKDGSLLTGDANVVHARISVKYEVAKPVDYLANVGNEQLADTLVRNVAEQAVIYTVARTTADDVIAGKLDRSVAVRAMQANLDAMKSGIQITELSATRTAMPMSVRSAYEAVVTAEQEKGQQIETARKERSTILEGVAGEAHSELLAMIDAYERASAANDTAGMQQLETQFDTVFNELNTGADRHNRAIGGEVAQVVNDAKTYRTQVVETVKAEARRFEQLLPQYEANPQIVRSRLWQDAREAILTSKNIEQFYTRGQLYIETNRRPDVAINREKARLQAEDQARRNNLNR